MAKIQKLSADGHHQECLQACQNALHANSGESYAYKYSGISLLALGQFQKAQECLVKAHHLDGRDPETVKDIGNIYLKFGDMETAIKWYEKALAINNNYAPAYANIATIKRKLGNNQEAINLFKKAIQADPKLIKAYVGLAATYLAEANLDQAQSFAEKALEISKNTPAVNEILGFILQSKSNADKAIEHYRAELYVNPQASNSLLNLGHLLLQKGETLAAITSLVKASTLSPNDQCSLLLAQAYQKNREYLKAIIGYKKLSKDKSNKKLISFNLGLCYLAIDDQNSAIEALQTAVQEDETFISAWENLGQALSNKGRLKEAMHATNKVLELDPDNPIALNNLGGIYKSLGKLDKALSLTLKSLELRTDNPYAHMNLSSIYKELGELNNALDSALKFLALKPENHYGHLSLGEIYAKLGQLDNAFKSTKKSIELDSQNPNSYLLLSSLYIKTNKPEQAKEACEQGLRINSKDIRLKHNLNSALNKITPIWHVTMMNDVDRNKCYEEAIRKAIRHNDLVLDIGAGSGLLSMIAADAGASKVIACESIVPIANAAKHIVRKNRFGEKINVLAIKSSEIKLGQEMPRKADVIISEIFSAEMVGEGILPTLRDARERLLKKGGLMIPESAQIKFALIGESPEVNSKTNPGFESCYALENFSEIVPKKISMHLKTKPNILSESKTAFHFDFRKSFLLAKEAKYNVTVTKDGKCIGIIQWLRTNLYEDITYENVPGKVLSHWPTNIFLFDAPISARKGERIIIDAIVEEDLLWFQHNKLD